MSLRNPTFGTDTLNIPCYLSSGPDDPGLAAWKSEHPDWLEIGAWTGAPQPRTQPREDMTQDTSLLEAAAGGAAPDEMVTMQDHRRTPAAALGIGATRPTGSEPGRERSSADWADDALGAATFRVGPPSVEWPDGVGPTIEKAAP